MEVTSVGAAVSNTIDISSPATDNKQTTGENVQGSTASIHDSLELSMNYSDSSVASIIKDIKGTLNAKNINNGTPGNGASIKDYASEYGRILKNINSNENFSLEVINNLTKILNNAYDDYAKDASDKIATKISSFFNTASTERGNYAKSGLNIGIKGDKLVDREALTSDIYDIFSAAKAFYKNNPNGSTGELDKALEKNFSETKSIEKLSYKDVNALQKAVDIANGNNMTDASSCSSPSERLKAMNSALENLKSEGASKIVTDAFEKAKDQNSTCFIREDAYNKIKASYSSRFSAISMSIKYYEDKLEEVKKQRQATVEANKKKLEKFQQKMQEEYLQLTVKDKEGLVKQLADMKEQQKKNLEKMDDYEKHLRDELEGFKIGYTKLDEDYDKFQNDPSSAIDEYIEINQNNGNDLYKMQ